MNIEELIIKRKSIRKYNLNPLDQETINKITSFISKIQPLFTSKVNFDFKIIDNQDFLKSTKGMFRCDAPHYLVFYGDNSSETYKNIGYVGEKMVLELTRMGLGTCWLGGAKSDIMINNKQYIISIAFGKPKEEFRKSISDAKRKRLDDIAKGYNDQTKRLLELARIAPSAMNFQPWYFDCHNNQIDVYRRKSGGILANSKGLKVMQQIDIGIVIAHLHLENTSFEVKDIDKDTMVYEGSIVVK